MLSLTLEELEFLIDIRDFITLFYVILRREYSKRLESFMESDLVCNLQYGTVYDFTFFKHSF